MVKFFDKTQNTIVSAAFIIGLSTGLSALLGLLKGRLLTKFFGIADELSVFYTADRIPNLVYSVLIVGAVSSVFIPVFTTKYKKNKEQAFEIANSMFTSVLMTFLVFGILSFLFARPLMLALSLGQFDTTQIELGASLMRIMIVSQLVLVVSSFVSSILQSYKYFTAAALAPVLYNLGMILGIVVLSPYYGIYGPAYGVVLGAFLHLFVQVGVLNKTDFRFSLNIKFDENLKKVFALVPPRIGSVTLANMIGIISNSLAILISTPSVVYLKFATQLQYFPVHLFGASLAAAALPTLSYYSDEEDLGKFKKTFLTSLHQMMFLVIPASMIFLILRVPAVRLVYGVENFPWEATVRTSYVLAFFSISIFAQSANFLFTRTFYALKDTKTPVLVSLVSFFVSISLSLFFIKLLGFGVWSVALAFSLGALLDFVLLLKFLSKKVGGFSFDELYIPQIKIGYSAILMGASLYLSLKVLDIYVLDTSKTIELIVLTFVAGCYGLFSYLFFTKWFKVEEIELLYRLIRKLKIRNALQSTVVETKHEM